MAYTKEMVEEFAQTFNRSNNQVTVLLNLLNGDIEKYIILECKIKDSYTKYCPSTLESVDEILNIDATRKFDYETELKKARQRIGAKK